MTSEENCLYISSRGFLKSCDIHSTTPQSSISYLLNYDFDFENKPDGTTIYVCSTAIQHFINNIKHIKYKFVLVTGDADECVPSEILRSETELSDILNHPKLIHWYSQNCVYEHAKMTKIPIGLDYHTQADMISPIDQEHILKMMVSKVKPFWEREIKCYSNFHFVNYETMKFGYMRSHVIEAIPSELVFYEPVVIDRLESWENQSNYAFVLSPHGNGLDCHRTWEALILGCIPIVKKSPIDVLYEGLPVLIVDEWSEINEDLLKATVEKWKQIPISYYKLTLSYWINKIKQY